MKKAITTGINGQDGSYLSEFLLDKGYKINLFSYIRLLDTKNIEYDFLVKIKDSEHDLDLDPSLFE